MTFPVTEAGVIQQWEKLASRVAAGDRFAGLFATARPARTASPGAPPALVLSAHVAAGGGIDTIETPLPPGAAGYTALTPLVGAAAWYERVIHDEFGVVPRGHPRLAPLVLHGSPEDHALPRHVAGYGLFTIPHGPVRSGVMESIEYLVETPGEAIGLLARETNADTAERLADGLARLDPTVHDLRTWRAWAVPPTAELAAAVGRNSALTNWLAALPGRRRPRPVRTDNGQRRRRIEAEHPVLGPNADTPTLARTPASRDVAVPVSSRQPGGFPARRSSGEPMVHEHKFPANGSGSALWPMVARTATVRSIPRAAVAVLGIA